MLVHDMTVKQEQESKAKNDIFQHILSDVRMRTKKFMLGRE